MRSLYGSATAFLKKHLLLRAAVLLALLLAAAFAADRFCTARPDIAEMLSEQFEQAVEQSGAVDEETGTIRLIPLFVQNFRATALMTLLGFIPFLFIPVLPILSNGVFLGATTASLAAHGVSVWRMLLLGVLPHGIFELPALALGAAAGICICNNLVRSIMKSGEAYPAKELALGIFKVYLCYILPLLVLAALTETYVSTRLILCAL